MKVLVVYKRSVYDLYSQSDDMKDFMASGSEDSIRMKDTHDRQQLSLQTVFNELSKRNISYESVYRADLKRIEGVDLVVVVGGDGTMLEVSHYVSDIPLLGVNSDPKTSVGHFCMFTAETFANALDNLTELTRSVLQRMELVQDGKLIKVPVLNDVFIGHPNPAATSRYVIHNKGNRTEHKDSGLLVATASGSTAWMFHEGGTVFPTTNTQLQFVSRGSRGAVPKIATELKVVSRTRQGKLFVDGPHIELDFPLGSELLLRKGIPLTILGDLSSKR